MDCEQTTEDRHSNGINIAENKTVNGVYQPKATSNVLGSSDSVPSKLETDVMLINKFKEAVILSTVANGQTEACVGKSKNDDKSLTTYPGDVNGEKERTSGHQILVVATVGNGRESSPSTDVLNEPTCNTSAAVGRDTNAEEKTTDTTQSNVVERKPISKCRIFYSENYMKIVRAFEDAEEKRSTNNLRPVITDQDDSIEPNNNADAPSIESKRSGDVKLIQQERMLTNDNVTHKPIVELNGRGTKCKIRYTKRFLDALLKEKEAALKQTTNVKPVVTVQGELKAPVENVDDPSIGTRVVSESRIESDKPRKTLAAAVEKEQPLPITRNLKTDDNIALKIFCDESIDQIETQTTNTAATDDHLFVLREPITCSIEETSISAEKLVIEVPDAEIPVPQTPLKDDPIDPSPKKSPDFSYFSQVTGVYGQIFLKEVVYPLCYDLSFNPFKW